MGLPPTLDELLPSAARRVLHLEMRDQYKASSAFAKWLAGEPIDYATLYGPWLALVGPVAARGVDVRRARVVSEPVSTYIRFEYDMTAHANLAAGEQVRWLPRGRASELALPGNDFWLVDDVVLFSLFSGDGAQVGTVVGGAEALAFAVKAFEAVWSLGTDHTEYKPA